MMKHRNGFPANGLQTGTAAGPRPDAGVEKIVPLLFPRQVGSAGFREDGKLLGERLAAEREGGLNKAWDIIDTPLEAYGRPVNAAIVPSDFNFKQFLLAKIEEAEKKGERLQVLDVGMGSGKQWEKFLRSHGHRFDFFATALTDRDLVEAVRGKETLCTAAELHLHFKPEKFDIIVSNFGTHFQERRAFAGIFFLLKRGGHGIVTGTNDIENYVNRMPPLKAIKNYKRLFEVRRIELGVSQGLGGKIASWAYHVKKL
ncbi:Uncharacterised protein [Candidatus Gugararchaeum adminiculabundum]|nr:Uncharacterised protein [Candidatus Gugararchaeum adminiculabundum]